LKRKRSKRRPHPDARDCLYQFGYVNDEIDEDIEKSAACDSSLSTLKRVQVVTAPCGNIEKSAACDIPVEGPSAACDSSLWKAQIPDEYHLRQETVLYLSCFIAGLSSQGVNGSVSTLFGVQGRNGSKNRPPLGESQRLQILQWNAGAMSPDKKIQVQKILQTYDVDIFTIMEANILDDKLKYNRFPGYTLYNLPKYRQVASGVLTRIKEGLTSHYDLIKGMGSTQDKCEIIRLNVWKC
uniref:Endo/exonuclease/phosphatase domain-containing protein n=1 Tax=Rodentolepis nana TaxID=102285 RepID=A0A0R3TDU5_RODNA